MVTMIEGIANLVMMAPLKAPHKAPLSKVNDIINQVSYPRLVVYPNTTEETAIMEATDRSICLAIITKVIVKAIIAFSLNRKVLSIRLYKSKK